MKFILFSAAFVLLTISTVSAQDACTVNAQNAIKTHNTATANQVAAAASIEQKAALAANANILAVENQIKLDLQNVIKAHEAVKNPSAETIGAWSAQAAFVAVQSDAYLAALRAAEASRVTVAADEATANALASVKADAALNVAIADCATIAALPIRADTCGQNAINAIKAEIKSNSDKVSAAALAEEKIAKTESAKIASVKRSVLVQVNAVLKANYVFNVNASSTGTPASLAATLSKQAELKSFVAVQASLMIAGLQASENRRKTYVDAKAAAFAVSEANLLVALNGAIVACNAILALPKPVGPSCAFNAVNAIKLHIQGSADNVTSAARLEKTRAELAISSIAAKGTAAELKAQTVWVANNLSANQAYTTKTVSETAVIVAQQATSIAASISATALERSGLLSAEADLEAKAATEAAAKAVAVASRLAVLNAVLAAC